MVERTIPGNPRPAIAGRVDTPNYHRRPLRGTVLSEFDYYSTVIVDMEAIEIFRHHYVLADRTSLATSMISSLVASILGIVFNS
jgi:hypothetical protein